MSFSVIPARLLCLARAATLPLDPIRIVHDHPASLYRHAAWTNKPLIYFGDMTLERARDTFPRRNIDKISIMPQRKDGRTEWMNGQPGGRQAWLNPLCAAGFLERYSQNLKKDEGAAGPSCALKN
jgi:hypothetical protein